LISLAGQFSGVIIVQAIGGSVRKPNYASDV